MEIDGCGIELTVPGVVREPLVVFLFFFLFFSFFRRGRDERHLNSGRMSLIKDFRCDDPSVALVVELVPEKCVPNQQRCEK